MHLSITAKNSGWQIALISLVLFIKEERTEKNKLFEVRLIMPLASLQE